MPAQVCDSVAIEKNNVFATLSLFFSVGNLCKFYLIKDRNFDGERIVEDG
jgi:hypothetical protein